MVTHRNTNHPVRSLSIGERTRSFVYYLEPRGSGNNSFNTYHDSTAFSRCGMRTCVSRKLTPFTYLMRDGDSCAQPMTGACKRLLRAIA